MSWDKIKKKWVRSAKHPCQSHSAKSQQGIVGRNQERHRFASTIVKANTFQMRYPPAALEVDLQSALCEKLPLDIAEATINEIQGHWEDIEM